MLSNSSDKATNLARLCISLIELAFPVKKQNFSWERSAYPLMILHSVAGKSWSENTERSQSDGDAAM